MFQHGAASHAANEYANKARRDMTTSEVRPQKDGVRGAVTVQNKRNGVWTSHHPVTQKQLFPAVKDNCGAAILVESSMGHVQGAL